jgi:hypothetical protein
MRANVVALPTTAQPEAAPAQPGPNELAVRQQCEQSPKAKDKPASVEQAVTMARILDNPEFAPMHPQASRQLQALLTDLGQPKTKSGGRLYAVQQMTRRRVVV